MKNPKEEERELEHTKNLHLFQTKGTENLGEKNHTSPGEKLLPKRGDSQNIQVRERIINRSDWYL